MAIREKPSKRVRLASYAPIPPPRRMGPVTASWWSASTSGVEFDANRADHGATFSVTLPVQVGREHMGGGLTNGQSPAALLGADVMLDGISVLLVDDQPEALTLVKRMLEERFAQVFTAASASEGMEMPQRVGPEVLISDIGMPEEDGLQHSWYKCDDSKCPGAVNMY